MSAQQKSRRDFLKLGVTAGLPLMHPSILKALEIPARSITRSVADVQHVVILMQENRSFDHYFGSLRGVRGFGDRLPFPKPDGQSVWHQKDSRGSIFAPFHMDTKSTSAQKVPDLNHSWESAQGAFNSGKWDQWVPYKSSLTMGHYRRDDLPFQYALADAFTICDAYHCSIHGCTSPNRIFFWAGGNDPKKLKGGPVITNNSSCSLDSKLGIPGFEDYGHGPRYAFTTYPERLEKAGISWKIYQDPQNNFAGLMNACVAFEQFNQAPKGSPLCDKGMSLWTLDDLKKDVANDRLPQVLWVCPSQEQSEHPSGSSPIEGASFTQQVLDTLTSNPEVWSKTVLFITFDENDGFYDHMPPPSPPVYRKDGSRAGMSTVDTEDDFHEGSHSSVETKLMLQAAKLFSMGLPEKMELEDTPEKIPYGMSVRVPMYIISPWSRGGWVNSQVFDHTSVIRFLEKRFGVTEPNITPWRRAVAGDLVSAFDFRNPNRAPFPTLPDTSKARSIVAVQSKLPVPVPPPDHQALWQEPGVRSSRALPYDLAVTEGTHQPDSFSLHLACSNIGTKDVAAVFYVYDKLKLDDGPRMYTVEDGKSLRDHWRLADSKYDLWIYGPNGFLRVFTGRHNPEESLEVRVERAAKRQSLTVSIKNSGKTSSKVNLASNAYFKKAATVTIAAGSTEHYEWPLSQSQNWYDFTASSNGNGFERRFAGRVETGKDSVSDPQLYV